MKKVSKAILIVLTVVGALAVALVVGLNFYVQSPGAQARIQEELSKALRLPLKITKSSVTPWSDLKITGISIPSGDANFLEATSFNAHYRLWPLLEGKLVITEMRVDSPKIIWVQNAGGKWALPEPEEAAEVSKEASKTAHTPDPGAPTEAPSKEKTPKTVKSDKSDRSDKAEPKKKNFDVIINRFDIKDGSFQMLDSDHKPVATFTGVNMVYTKLTAEMLEGTAAIAKAVWNDGYTLENIKTPFSYQTANQEMWLPEFTATLAGGALRGNYRSHAGPKHTPFNATLEFDGVKLDPLVVQSGGEAGQATGVLRGKLEFHGETDRMDKVEGEGSLHIRDGRFRQLELFQTIARILDITELADLHIADGQADFHVAGDKIMVDLVDLQAQNLALMAKNGTLRPDKNDKKVRKIALDARLSVDDAIVARLPGKIPESFTPDAQPGRHGIDFNVSGTTSNPKTNLGDKLIATTINGQFNNLLGTLFGEKKDDPTVSKKDDATALKKEDDKRKKDEDPKKADKKDKKKKDKDKDKAAATSPDTTGASPSAAQTTPPADPAPAAAPNL